MKMPQRFWGNVRASLWFVRSLILTFRKVLAWVLIEVKNGRDIISCTAPESLVEHLPTTLKEQAFAEALAS